MLLSEDVGSPSREIMVLFEKHVHLQNVVGAEVSSNFNQQA